MLCCVPSYSAFLFSFFSSLLFFFYSCLSKPILPQLRRIFAQYWTLNTNLQSYLLWRLRNDPMPGGATEPVDLRAVPCAFRPATAPLPQRSAPAGAGEEIEKLLTAVALLESASDRKPDGVTLIESLLRQRRPESDWSAPHYAALAARASLAAGDTEKTRNILELGLKHAPDDAQLQYLARILKREQPSHPKLSSTQ